MQKKPVNRVCFIPGCTSEYGQVLFMSAYKSDGLQQWWSESAWSQNRKNKTIPKNTRVCERHFEERFIDRSYKMPRLFPDAWPTMNVVEPKPEDLEGGGRGRCRVDGRGRPPGRTETNPKYYCRLCGKREKRPLEDLMCDLKDGEDLLKYLLGQYYGRVDLPQGVCDDCMDTAESFVEFVRKCEETQLKLERIFVENEALKLEPDCELLENTTVVQLKQEKVEVVEDMEAEYLEQPQESPRDVKPVELITNDDPPPEDYGEDPPDGFDDGGGDSDSEQSDEDSKSAAEEEEEKRPRRRRKSRVSDSSDEDSFVESDDESDSEDDKPLRKREVVVPKKRGRKPKQKLLEDYENETKPKVGRGRKKSATAASQETSRICPICGKILIHKGNFTSHLKIHSEKKDYVCNICGKQYYIRRELQMHIESLHEKKTFVCNICGIKCAWRKGLQRHMKNKHSDESSLKHKCTYCGKAFLLPNQLRLHVMKHTGDRITCEICGAGYRFNYMLTQHKMREHGMEFKGVKLYKNSNRSRKGAASKQQQPAGSAQPEPNQPPPPPSTTPATVEVIVPHMLEPSHDSMMSSESSQSHPIQQQQQQHHHSQQYHPGHYPAGFVYPPGGHAVTAPAAMMLPPGSYSG